MRLILAPGRVTINLGDVGLACLIHMSGHLYLTWLYISSSASHGYILIVLQGQNYDLIEFVVLIPGHRRISAKTIVC